jgi:hypothetical protein
MKQVSIPAFLNNKTMGVCLLNNKTKIRSDHFKGYALSKMSLWKGLSKKEKEALYGNAKKIVSLAFMDELRKQGVQVLPLEDNFPAQEIPSCAYLLRVKMDTSFFKEISRSFNAFTSFQGVRKATSLVQTATRMRSYLDSFKNDYVIAPHNLKPASRVMAVNLLTKISDVRVKE